MQTYVAVERIYVRKQHCSRHRSNWNAVPGAYTQFVGYAIGK
jgi:hypothetical protein